MYLDMVLIVDITEDVVAGDWMTAVREDKLPDGILADDHRPPLVKVLADDEFLNFLVLLFLRFLLLANEGHEAFPPGHTTGRALFPPQFSEVVVAKDDTLVAKGEEKALMFLKVMEVADTVYNGVVVLYAVVIKPVAQCLLTLPLYLTALLMQYGLYLRLCLCRGHEIYP